MDKNKIGSTSVDSKSLNGNKTNLLSDSRRDDFIKLSSSKKVDQKIRFSYQLKMDASELLDRLAYQPFSYHKYDRELLSMLYPEKVKSPWLYKDFELIKIDMTDKEFIQIPLSDINTGELFNHLMRNAYTFEIENGTLIVYPKTKLEALEFNSYIK